MFSSNKNNLFAETNFLSAKLIKPFIVRSASLKVCLSMSQKTENENRKKLKAAMTSKEEFMEK